MYPLSHRNTGGGKLAQDQRIGRVRIIGASVHKNSDLHTSLEALNQRAGNVLIVHEPEGNIDLLGLSLDKLKQRCTTVLERDVTKLLSGCDGSRG